MPELRKDSIVERWVIVAEGRSARPQDFKPSPVRGHAAACPFCAGAERETPGELFALRDAGTNPNQPGWRVRVVPNMFPALVLAETEAPLPLAPTGDFFARLPGLGAHEVVIECPEHLAAASELGAERLADVFAVYRQRLLALKQDKRLAHATAFKNVGPAAGASLEHLHSQIIATPMTSLVVAEELAGSRRYFEKHGRCVFCEMIDRELAAGDRLVIELADLVAFCPFASRFPYETWVLPRSHASHFETITPAQTAQLGLLMQRLLARFEALADPAAYNYIIHSAPFDTFDLGHYHWHMEITPRLTEVAGFELGAGFHINPRSPEKGAAWLAQ